MKRLNPPFITIALLFALAFSISCTTSRVVKPLEKGQWIATADLGGPLITNLGAPLPVPLTSLSASRGVTDRITISGGLHPTALFFKNLQMDVSATIGLLKYESTHKAIPGVSITPGVNALSNFRGAPSKFWPTLDINGFYPYKEGNSFFYIGWQHFVELDKLKPDGTTMPSVMRIAPHLGHTMRKEKWYFTSELKFLAPGLANNQVVVDYVGIGNRGALGLYFSLSRTFGPTEQ